MNEPPTLWATVKYSVTVQICSNISRLSPACAGRADRCLSWVLPS